MMIDVDIRNSFQSIETDFYSIKSLQEEITAKETKFKQSIKDLKASRYSFGTLVAEYVMKNKSRFCTVTQLLNNYVRDQDLIAKELSSDFLYVYEDAIGQYRLVYPAKFVCFSIYDRKQWKKGNLQRHEEDYIIKFIKDFAEAKENWYADITNADSLNILSKAGIQVRSAFVFLDRQRNLPHNSKDHKISVFRIDELGNDEDIISNGRKLILQINEFLK